MSTTTILTPEQLKTLSDAAVKTVPDGHSNAIIGTVDQDGAQIVAVAKLGPSNNWDVTAAARHDWSGDNEVGASVIYSW